MMTDLDLNRMTVTDMENMRRDAHGTFSVAPTGRSLGAARRVVAAAGMDRSYIVAESARVVETAPLGPDGPGEWSRVGTLPGDLLSAVSHGDTVDMMTTAGVWRMVLEADGSWRAAGLRPELPWCRFESADAGSVAVSVEAMELTDLSRLVAAHTDAYERLAAEARADGCVFQPAVVRCRISDQAGRTVMMTPPVVVGAAQDYYDASRAVSGDTAAGYTLSGNRTRVTLHIGGTVDKAWREIAARLEVLASPALHGIDPRAAGSARRHATGTSGGEAVTVVAAGSAFDSRRGPVSASTLGRVAVSESAMRTVLTIESPFDEGSPQSISLEITPAGSVADELRMLDRALAEKAATTDRQLAALQPPRRYTARCMATSGRLTLMGDIEEQPGALTALPAMAVETADRPWRGAVEIRMNDGSTAVWHGEGLTGAPVRLSPLLAYPDSRAVGMTVAVSSNGEVRCAEYELRASADGSMALWAGQTLGPESPGLSDRPYAIPAEQGSTRRHRGLVVAATSAGGTPLTAADLGTGVTALTAAPAAASGWEFGREHFLAGCGAGIVKVSVNSGATAISHRTIDRRPVESAGAMAPREEGVAVIAGGDLLEVGRTRVETLRRGIGGSTVACSTSRGEIWTAGADGAEITPDSGSNWRYTRSRIESVAGAGGEVYGITADGRLEALSHRQSMARSASIALRGEVSVASGRKAGVRRVRLPRIGRDATVEVVLNSLSCFTVSHAGDEDIEVVARLTPCRSVKVEMTGTARATAAAREKGHNSINDTDDAGKQQ